MYTFRTTLRRATSPPFSASVACAIHHSTPSAALQSNPYPYPPSQNPTPYQIFHLSPKASPSDIKQRYYELVKLYHPDSAESRRLEPDPVLRHTRFSAITRAYARLQSDPAASGHSGINDIPDHNNKDSLDPSPWRRTPYTKTYCEDRFVDERWKDGLIWGILGFSIITIVAQAFSLRKKRNPQAYEEYVMNVASESRREIGSGNNTADEDALKLTRKSTPSI